MKQVTLTEWARNPRQVMEIVENGDCVAIVRARRGRVGKDGERTVEVIAVMVPATAYRVTLQALENIAKNGDMYDFYVEKEAETALAFLDEGDGDD